MLPSPSGNIFKTSVTIFHCKDVPAVRRSLQENPKLTPYCILYLSETLLLTPADLLHLLHLGIYLTRTTKVTQCDELVIENL